MNETFVYGHLGLGDHLICNGLIRGLHERYHTINVICKQHNLESLQFMWDDVFGVRFMPVQNDGQADELWDDMRKDKDRDFIGLGLHHEIEECDNERWDVQFYEQANVDIKSRWANFHVGKLPTQLHFPDEPYILVHHDPKRNFIIDHDRLDPNKKHVDVCRFQSGSIFEWIGAITHASEIHCIDSSFAILVDHIHFPVTKKLFIHNYARKGNPPTKWKRKWTWLD